MYQKVGCFGKRKRKRKKKNEKKRFYCLTIPINIIYREGMQPWSQLTRVLSGRMRACRHNQRAKKLVKDEDKNKLPEEPATKKGTKYSIQHFNITKQSMFS